MFMKIHIFPTTAMVILLCSFFTTSTLANISDTLYHPLATTNKAFLSVDKELTANYLTLQKIIPHLIPMRGQIATIQNIMDNYQKVEKLWGYYEEAKRDGTRLDNHPISKELAFSTEYTLHLLDADLDNILSRLNNEDLRLALVDWKKQKLIAVQKAYQKDTTDLSRLEQMKPSMLENPTISNTQKLANLLEQRAILYNGNRNAKVIGEFRRNTGNKLAEVDLFYTCDTKKRIADKAPENLMEFANEQAIQLIRLDREIYQFRKIALTTLPYKEQQYFKLKKQLAVAEAKEVSTKKRMFTKKKEDPMSHHSLILKEYNQLVDSFSFEEQQELRTKEAIYNHEVISRIEFWGCPAFFPAFYER